MRLKIWIMCKEMDGKRYGIFRHEMEHSDYKGIEKEILLFDLKTNSIPLKSITHIT
jgi:hypothetical protein